VHTPRVSEMQNAIAQQSATASALSLSLSKSDFIITLSGGGVVTQRNATTSP
jgi:ribosomal protein S9